MDIWKRPGGAKSFRFSPDGSVKRSYGYVILVPGKQRLPYQVFEMGQVGQDGIWQARDRMKLYHILSKDLPRKGRATPVPQLLIAGGHSLPHLSTCRQAQDELGSSSTSLCATAVSVKPKKRPLGRAATTQVLPTSLALRLLNDPAFTPGCRPDHFYDQCGRWRWVFKEAVSPNNMHRTLYRSMAARSGGRN
jgi:hypothetical protein